MNLARYLGLGLRALNIADAACTVYVVSALGAAEINPAMRYLLDISPWFFVLVKVLVVGLGAEFLTRMNQVILLGAMNAVYLAVVGYHFWMVF